MEPILSMRDICKSFHGKLADDHVNLDVYPGEVHALLGENGAGKSTLMNVLYGMYSQYTGEIYWKGNPVHFRSPKDAINCKIGMVHQHFMLVPNLSVSENITLGLKSKGYPFTDRKYINEKLASISEKYGLKIDPEAIVSTLSVGEQQRVEIIKLLYRDVELLILDEPTAVLTPGETEDFFKVLKNLRDDGRSVIIITHRIPEVMEISDRVTVLRDAKMIASLETKNLTPETLSEYMIGRQLKQVTRKPAMETNEPGLVVDNVVMEEKGQKLLDGISIKVAPGEILGIAGVDGNGQKHLAEAIVGIKKYQSGHISLGQTDLDGLSVNQRKKLGIGYISDDRHKDGLIMTMSLKENMLLRSTKETFVKKGFIDRKAVQSETEEAANRFAIKAASLSMPIASLSGGNQQKLILAREIYEGVKLVIAFQPTRGLDIGASEFIRELLLNYRDSGCCVLLISADLEEIFSISDRVAVIHRGKINGEVYNDGNVDMTKFGLLMAGHQEEKEGE